MTLRGRRVLIVLSTLEVGGTERQVCMLARHLSTKEGARVIVWGMGEPGRLVPMLERDATPWRYVKKPWSWRGYVRIALRLRYERPDVILAFNHLANVVMARLWRFSGARLLVWNQRDEGWRDSVAVESAAAKRVPYFLSNSHHGARYLREGLGAPSGAIDVVANGIVAPRPVKNRAAWRAELGLAGDGFAACMVANLHSYKDHPTLIRAWRRVVDAWPAAKPAPVLLLAGRFDDAYPELVQLTHTLGLEHQVRFLGPVDDVAGVLCAADLAVFSSRNEGLPNGVLEPMSLGLAVAATDYPGIREALGDGANAFLAPPQNAQALGEIILRLAADPALRKSAGEANQRRIETVFHPDAVFGRYAALIAQRLSTHMP